MMNHNYEYLKHNQCYWTQYVSFWPIANNCSFKKCQLHMFQCMFIYHVLNLTIVLQSLSDSFPSDVQLWE